MISTITIFVMTSSIAVGQPMLNSDWFSKTNDGPIENKVKCDKQSNNELSMAYEPGGEGLFRDPLEVLGPRFPTTVAINMCELELLIMSTEVSDVTFTERGKRMCTDICRQYRTNMRTDDGSAKVALAETYCDYTGVISFRDDLEPDLSSVCTCAYKVACNRRIMMITYLFETNFAGFLRVKVSGTSVPKDVT